MIQRTEIATTRAMVSAPIPPTVRARNGSSVIGANAEKQQSFPGNQVMRSERLARHEALWHLGQMVLVSVVADRAGHAGRSAPTLPRREPDGPRKPTDYCRIAHRTSWDVNFNQHGTFFERKEISEFGKVLSGLGVLKGAPAQTG
jgi:hypothetical protein